MQRDEKITQAHDDPKQELSAAELESEAAAELPEREAMSIVSTDPVIAPAITWPEGPQILPGDPT